MELVRLDVLARRQNGVVAVWQLRTGGWTEKRIATAVRPMRRMHDGVYLSGYAPPTPLQHWQAAALTTPESVLSHLSAATFWRMTDRAGANVTVSRPGLGNPKVFGTLKVHYSSVLAGETCRRSGVAVTRPERSVLDSWPLLDDWSQRKLLREALRTDKVTVASLTAALDRHPGRRGIGPLRTCVARYARLQLERCRSDAEAYAMEILDDQRRPLPDVNVRRAGEEADLSWPAHRLIVEIDGQQFHFDKFEDARKTRAWRDAGWTVKRISSDDVFARPDRLLALAPLR